MKKIGFVIGSMSHGGAERVISILSNLLSQKYCITIITFKESPSFYPLNKSVLLKSCKIKDMDRLKGPIGSIRLNYKIARNITSIVKEEKIDLLIGFITSSNVMSIIAARLNRIPCIICERNNPKKEYLSFFWRMSRMLFYPLANVLTVQTVAVKEYYLAKKLNSNILVLKNPISPELSQLVDHTPNRKNIILSVGRLDTNKNQKSIIEAFSNLKDPSWSLLLIGDGGMKKELEAMISRMGQTERIQIISGVKDIHNYYNKAKIFVFASNSEGFPNALLEAMHFGLACISTDCDYGPRELIENMRNGILISTNELDELTKSTIELSGNQQLIASLGNNAQRESEKYKAENVISEWEKTINKLLN
ncbi:glycosyltransferase [Flagellimonas olearia]|nr:glycosyltransferase [Allomuricauda olearia]